MSEYEVTGVFLVECKINVLAESSTQARLIADIQFDPLTVLNDNSLVKIKINKISASAKNLSKITDAQPFGSGY